MIELPFRERCEISGVQTDPEKWLMSAPSSPDDFSYPEEDNSQTIE